MKDKTTRTITAEKRSDFFKAIVSGLILPYNKQITKLLSQRNKIKSAEKIKEIDSDIRIIIDHINALKINSKKVKSDNLALGRVLYLENFVKSAAYSKYKKLAEDMVLEGNYVPQFLFAGGATRFGFGAMWTVDLAALSSLILGRYGLARKYMPESAVAEFKDKRLGTLKGEQLETAQDKLLKMSRAGRPVHIGMGPRQILQYRIRLERLAVERGVNPEKVLSRAKLVVNLNENIKEQAVEEFFRNDFYGFCPENVYFVVQPTFHGFRFSEGALVEDRKKEPLPFGHGLATLDIFLDCRAFTVNRGGRLCFLNGSVIDRLIGSGCVMMGSHRINDMTKWSDDIVSIDKLAFGLFQFNENKKEVAVELVENPHNQKGGHWLRAGNKEFLAESLSLSTPELKTYIDSLENEPYNAFRNMYNIVPLKRRIKSEQDIKLNVRYKEGMFYLESVTGDITLKTASVAFQKKGEVIHDIKSISNYIDEGIDFAFRQDRDKRFVELARKLRR